ncbi:DUF4168 domain-containing protein [Pseudoponticoccus marisrubri]|uniref:DUF4168 domain-containing protein n=1 Tax=Pseudoponticoccus marisrubri TaxID=1685382 RepID=A0A0W7WQL0_9RHOB|nr:DUF4168 domain-containing protein [Pseudoponticoccus marisrubri]KUF12877.1 hypothetical protein AVJ23_03575 [Pseudoponticoccus marisrubri]
MSARTTLLGTAVIAALAAAPMSTAFAQEAEAPQAEAIQVTDAMLSDFVDAAMKVMALRQTYEVRLQAAETQEDRQALVAQAQSDMRSAIEETDGMTVETYAQIGEAAQADEELNQRVVALIQERVPEDAQPQGDG